MKLKASESYDRSQNKYRRVYSLDNERLCFLSVFLTEQRVIESISFDVEAADDYHYKIEADQLPQLCKALRCQYNEKDIAKAFAGQRKGWKNPIEIASLLDKAGVKYQPFHFY